MKTFTIRFLDHVAIRVKDIEKSAKWYHEVLGLTRYDVKEWGAFPVFLLSGKSGIALFPEDMKGDKKSNLTKSIRIDHFAFNVDLDNFKRAKIKFETEGIEFKFSDHIHFYSMYLKDPDDHVVELTCFVGQEENFYKD